MSTVDLQDLKEHAEDLISRVEADGGTIEIVRHGRVAALLIPSPEPNPGDADKSARRAQTERTAVILDHLWSLGDKISEEWPKGVSAVDAIRDVRRNP